MIGAPHLSFRRRIVVGILAGSIAAVAALWVSPHAQAADATDAFGAPLTSSAVTVSGRGDFRGMSFSVNQTQNLTNQALSISWSGGDETSLDASKYAFNYVQVMQCWGDPITDPADTVNYNAADPGPPREQCEFGAPPDSSALVTAGQGAAQRITTMDAEEYGGRTAQYGTVPGVPVKIPFKSATGDVVTGSNQFYDFTTTNEIDGARTYSDKTGHVWFQADTNFEAPGLGCGAARTGSDALNPCWLVIVPRGNKDANGATLTNGIDLSDSPLVPQAWENRVAIPLGFQPLAGSCPSGTDEMQTNGSQLMTGAMTSWQPALCANGGSVFSYTSVADDQARDFVAHGTTPFIFTSRPLTGTQIQKSSPVLYAPVALSGATIGFNIELTGPAGSAGKQKQHLNLTPRLAAKLLTFSYRANYPAAVDDPHTTLPPGATTAPGYEWLLHNPYSIAYDPEFIRYNPGLQINGTAFNSASVIVELGNFDAARAVWDWILADPVAKAWMSGQADDWGMTVSPYYATTASLNRSGTAFDPEDSFPESDPWQNFVQQLNPATGEYQKSSPITMVDYHPYATDMTSAARMTLLANDGERTFFQAGAAVGNGFSANGPQPEGSRIILSVTDTASAAQFGLQEAGLSRAGDDYSNPTFITPTRDSISAAAQAMQPLDTASGLLWPNSAAAGGAYPLSMLTYGATIPANLTKTECSAFSNLLVYAATKGQVTGDAIGELPPGYVSLPSSLSSKTIDTAATLASCPKPAASPTSTPKSSPATSAASGVTPVRDAPVTVPPAQAPILTPPPWAPTAAPTAQPAAPVQDVLSAAPVLILAAGTTPSDPPSFTAALPVGVMVGVLAGLAAPLLSGAGSQALTSLRRVRVPRSRGR